MFDRLPTELSQQIVLVAAESLIETRRQSIVHLAQTSSAVYSIVGPILHRALVVTARNAHHIVRMLEEHSTRSRVFRHLRTIAIHDDYPCRCIANRETCLFSNLAGITRLSAADRVIQRLLQHNDALNITKLFVLNGARLPTCPPSVTHISFRIQRLLVSAELLGRLQNAPHATHFAFDFGPYFEEYAELPDMLLTALSVRPGVSLALSIHAEPNAHDHWLRCLEAVKRTGSDKIAVWRDMREVDWRERAVCDAYAGRDAWSEGVLVKQ